MELQHIAAKDAERLLGDVLNFEINYIDTSPGYGQSQDIIGKALSHRRSDFYLATKYGNHHQSGGEIDPALSVWNREALYKQAETSLRLLNTGYIDVWYLQNITPDNLDDEVIDAVLTLKQQGKI